MLMLSGSKYGAERSGKIVQFGFSFQCFLAFFSFLLFKVISFLLFEPPIHVYNVFWSNSPYFLPSSSSSPAIASPSQLPVLCCCCCCNLISSLSSACIEKLAVAPQLGVGLNERPIHGHALYRSWTGTHSFYECIHTGPHSSSAKSFPDTPASYHYSKRFKCFQRNKKCSFCLHNCTCAAACMEVRGQLVKVRSLFLPCRSQGWNSGCTA